MIKIQPPTAQDNKLFIEAMIASKDYHSPWTTVPTTKDQFDEYLLKYSKENNKSFLIIYDEAIAGVVNLNEIVYGAFKSAYMGYYGVKQFAGKGIMLEGMRLVVESAFNDLGLHRLEANIQPDNIRSINLVKKLGFSKEGFSPKYLYINNQWCDHERWAIINE
jgi:RimJ/RimL family protein N-acetyltransferase